MPGTGSCMSLSVSLMIRLGNAAILSVGECLAGCKKCFCVGVELYNIYVDSLVVVRCVVDTSSFVTANLEVRQ